MTGVSKQAESATTTLPSRLPSLTGMRFIAAALVFLFHVSYANLFASERVAGTLMTVFGQGGWTGVGFFFVLSGFVLT